MAYVVGMFVGLLSLSWALFLFCLLSLLLCIALLAGCVCVACCALLTVLALLALFCFALISLRVFCASGIMQ